MTSDSGSVMRQVAIAAMDTRVILGALVGWSLLSRVSFGTIALGHVCQQDLEPI